jgi:hypothetical protein
VPLKKVPSRDPGGRPWSLGFSENFFKKALITHVEFGLKIDWYMLKNLFSADISYKKVFTKSIRKLKTIYF